MPLGDGITFKYGGYEFSPRPLFTVNKTVVKTPANTGLTSKYVLVLNGHILPTDVDLDDNKAGLTTVWDDTYALRDAFEKDFELLSLKCDTNPEFIISGFPKVVSVDINPASDNFVRRTDYTINLELPTLIGTRSDSLGLADSTEGDLSTAGLVSVSEDTSIEFLDERVTNASPDPIWADTLPTVFRITRNVSAQGDSLPPDASESSKYIEPWERARKYVEDTLMNSTEFTDYFSGTMCLTGKDIRNSFRTMSVNHMEGSCNGSQTFVVLPMIASGTIEDFEASIEQSNDSPFTTVNINGTIKGFDDITGPVSGCPTSAEAGEDKFRLAKAKWDAY